MDTQLLIMLLLLWSGTGVVTALWLRLRGHDFVSWAAVGVVFGPLVVPLARLRAVTEPRGHRRVVLAGVPGEGDLAVLVGVDGSPESLHALEQAVRLFGSRMGTLTVATAVDFETANEIEVTVLPSEARDRVHLLLDEAAASIAPFRPETVILSGRAHEALADAAADHDVLVIGPRGRGRSESLFGSAATALATGAPVPVLIVGSTAEAHTSASPAGAAATTSTEPWGAGRSG